MDNICIDCRKNADCKHKPRTNQWKVAGCSWFEADPVITNADQIRSMTDEEMAKWVKLMVCKYRSCGNCPMADWCTADRGILDWLKSPVEEGDE